MNFDPTGLLSASVVFLLLIGSATLASAARERLPERHRGRDTAELMQLTINLLVTFAALVLGLMTATVKHSFDQAGHDRQTYTMKLAALDVCLRDYGPESQDIRNLLHGYVAAVIASTWPDEPPPTGVAYPDTSRMPRTGGSPVLAGLMNRIGTDINRLPASGPFQQRMLAMCAARYRDVMSVRTETIVDTRQGLVRPFYVILVSWLMIMFACFGLMAPLNGITGITLLLCAFSLSSVIFVIGDLDQPYGGLFSIPSSGMRDALTEMLAQNP